MNNIILFNVRINDKCKNINIKKFYFVVLNWDFIGRHKKFKAKKAINLPEIEISICLGIKQKKTC